MSTQSLPPNLKDSFLAKFPKLSRAQAGHLRHFHNIATQKNGEWRHMGSQAPGQEWLDAYRYQLATMVYAAGVAHYHRLPLLRSVFKALIGQLINKMLHHDVWGYWFLTSHSGKFVDPDLTELRQPWADPIKEENIMVGAFHDARTSTDAMQYSGHLLLMVSLYTMLFDDDRYNESDALVFNWSPIFWGMGPERFSYTRQTLQKAILDQMEREKWLGVCCEPNSIFIVCNQFPNYITAKYNEAWKAKGMAQEDGLLIRWFSPKQQQKQFTNDIGSTAWAHAFMNAWNPEVAHDTFKQQAVGFLASPVEGHVRVNHQPLALEIRDLVSNEGADPLSPSTYTRAQEILAFKDASPAMGFPLSSPVVGYAIQWVSEVGDQPTLDGMLSYVDANFAPQWDQGGLFYPARPKMDDDSLTAVDTFTGNAGIAYARLNVFDGQRKMYEEPWTGEYLSSKVFLDGVDLSSSVDFLRGIWDEEDQALVFTVRTWDGSTKQIQPKFSGFAKGSYGIYMENVLQEVRDLEVHGDAIELDLTVTGQELDIVILRSTES
ncbi:hypothetical protein ACHAPT_012430 [Fusarium lateritium]